MINKIDRPPGVYFVGWSVVVFNVFVILSYYFHSYIDPDLFDRLLSFVSMLAVFPKNLFHSYLISFKFAHFCWIFIMVFSSFGIMMFNPFARNIFIIFNVLHVVILANLVFMRFGTNEFLEAFFVLYFNAVASGSYIAFITTPVVRSKFTGELEGIKLRLWFNKAPVIAGGKKNHYALGLAYIKLGRMDDAIEEFKKDAEEDLDNPRSFYEMGKVFIDQKRYGDAVDALKKAISVDPIHFEATYQLGMAYVYQGCAKEASQMFLRATHIDPNRAEAYTKLGEAYLSLKSFDEAFKSFNESLELQPDNAEVYFERGMLFWKHRCNKKSAREDFKKSVRINPNFNKAFFNLGLLESEMTRYKDALRAFKGALSLDTEDKQVHYNMGITYAKLGDYNSARREAKWLKNVDVDLYRGIVDFMP